MPVDAASSDYLTHAEFWQLCRDVRGGQHAIHKARVKYLPMIGRPNSPFREELYKTYLERAPFDPLFGLTVDTFTGMIFRKPPVMSLAPKLAEWARDVTADGKSLLGFAEDLVEEVMTPGRAGILVDHQTAPESDGGLSVAQAEALGLRPFWRMYRAEDIRRWKVEYVPGRGMTLTQVVLKEAVEEPGEDEFETVEVEQYRVLKLTDKGYMQQVWRRPADGAEYAVIEEITPLMNGAAMPFIPFVFVGPRSTDAKCERPPLLDLAYINITHYRLGADLYHAMRYAGNPQPVVIGMSPEDEGFPTGIGPSEIWGLRDKDCKVQYLQIDSEGLRVAQSEIDRVRASAAAAGARAIAPDTRGAETAQALSIRASGQNSVVASIAMAVSAAVMKAMEYTAMWLGLDVPEDERSFRLNTDYLPARVDATLLRELMSAVQQGLMSRDSFYTVLVENEVLSPTRTFEEEAALIEEESGTGLGMDFSEPPDATESAQAAQAA